MNVIQRILRSWARVHPVAAPEARDLDARGWARLARVARREGVAGLVFRAITTVDRDLEVPPDVRAALRRVALDQAAAHAWEQKVLAEILRAFDAADLHPILLRGHDLVEEIYLGDGSLRPQVDHDILVPPDQMAAAGVILESIGFEQVLCGWTLFRRDRSLVDLHSDPYDRFRVPSRGRILTADVAGIFSRACLSTLSAAPMLRTSPSDRLLILCAHTVKHSFDRLIRLVDIAEAWRELRSDPATLASQALEEGTSDALYYSLMAARARLGASVLDQLLEQIPPPGRSFADRLFEAYLQGGSCPLFSEWLLLSQLEGVGARSMALWEMISPPGERADGSAGWTTGRLAAASSRAARLAGATAGSLTRAILSVSGNGNARSPGDS